MRAIAVVTSLSAALVLGPGAPAAEASPPGSVVALNPGQPCQATQPAFSDNGLWAAWVGYQCPGAPSQWAAFAEDLQTGVVTAVSPATHTVSSVDVDDEGDVAWSGYSQPGSVNTLRLWRRGDDTTTEVAVENRTSPVGDALFFTNGPLLSSDGQYVGFVTSSRLVDEDTNASTSDAYVRDMLSDGVSYDYVPITGDSSGLIDMSADGRHLTFSTGSGLDPIDTNSSYDVYEADLSAGGVSYDLIGLPDGVVSPTGTIPTSLSQHHMLSADGSRALFSVTGNDAFVRDRESGEVWQVGRDATGTWTNGYALVLDAAGTHVAFLTNGFGPDGHSGWWLSDGTELLGCDAKNQTLLEELATGEITLASVSTTGGAGSGGPDGVFDCNGTSLPLAVSAGGGRVIMNSNRLDLVSPALAPAQATPYLFYAYDRDRPALPTALSTPVVTGAAVGADATCDPGSWYPAATTDLSYAWFVNDGEVIGESATTYRVALSDSGKSLVCEVTGSNATGSSTAASAPVVVPVVSTPVAGTVTVTGTVGIGSTLTCSTGAWGGAPAPDLFYDWTRAGTTGSVATTTTYVLTTADATHAVRCAVTGVNVAGSTSRTSSNSVTLPAAPVLKKVPTLTANPSPPRTGSTLTCGTGSWTGASSYQYSFARNGGTVRVLGTVPTYTVVAADLGASLTCTVRATNTGGSTDATSAALVVPPVPSSATAPVLSWKNPLRAGTRVSSTTGTWTPTTPALSFSYQWTRNGTVIPGATSSTYTILAADVGTSIRSQVRATNTSGSSAFVVSSNAVTP